MTDKKTSLCLAGEKGKSEEARRNRCRAKPGRKNKNALRAVAVRRAIFLLAIYFFLTPLTVSFRPLPGLKAGTLEALILMASPVWGFLPVRAARLRTS